MEELGNYAGVAAAARLAGGEMLLDASRIPGFFAVLCKTIKPLCASQAVFKCQKEGKP